MASSEALITRRKMSSRKSRCDFCTNRYLLYALHIFFCWRSKCRISSNRDALYVTKRKSIRQAKQGRLRQGCVCKFARTTTTATYPSIISQLSRLSLIPCYCSIVVDDDCFKELSLTVDAFHALIYMCVCARAHVCICIK